MYLNDRREREEGEREKRSWREKADYIRAVARNVSALVTRGNKSSVNCWAKGG